MEVEVGSQKKRISIIDYSRVLATLDLASKCNFSRQYKQIRNGLNNMISIDSNGDIYDRQ